MQCLCDLFDQFSSLLPLKGDDGKKVWEFDKRYFTEKGLPDPVAWPPEDKVRSKGGGCGPHTAGRGTGRSGKWKLLLVMKDCHGHFRVSGAYLLGHLLG